MSDSGWTNLTLGINVGSGALWTAGEAPWSVGIPESEQSAVLVVTEPQSPIEIPTGATDINVTYRLSGGQDDDNNNTIVDRNIWVVIGGEPVGANLAPVFWPASPYTHWEVSAGDHPFTPGSFGADFGVGISLGAEANGPEVITNVWLTEIQVRATWTPPVPFVAREQIQYA